MAKNGMHRGVWQRRDPTFAQVLGMERKEKRTMAEKMAETSIAGKESIFALSKLKTATADMSAKMSGLVYRAQQAQTVEDLNRLIADAMEIEDKMYSAGRSISRVCYHLIAMKIDLLPKPKSEAADE